MSTFHINALILRCDGCGTALLNEQQFTSAIEARAVAYNEGWRFPPQLSRTKGKPLGNRTSDVCPACLPGWELQTHGGTRAGYEGQKIKQPTQEQQ